MSEWISVEERLPEQLVDILVHHAKGKIDISFMCADGFLMENRLGKVTHWMPLPEPPKEE